MAASTPGQRLRDTAEALAEFDALPVVEVAFMLGKWRGEGYPSGHPLDGLLEAYHWHGKHFESPEAVHPLVFQGLGGGQGRIDPGRVGPLLPLAARLPMPRGAVAGRMFQLCMPLLATAQSRARLRMTSYRGKTSATMLYDQLPICDVFRRVDDNTVLGVMDHKAIPQPFFFLLHREGLMPPDQSPTDGDDGQAQPSAGQGNGP